MVTIGKQHNDGLTPIMTEVVTYFRGGQTENLKKIYIYFWTLWGLIWILDTHVDRQKGHLCVGVKVQEKNLNRKNKFGSLHDRTEIESLGLNEANLGSECR